MNLSVFVPFDAYDIHEWKTYKDVWKHYQNWLETYENPSETYENPWEPIKKTYKRPVPLATPLGTHVKPMTHGNTHGLMGTLWKPMDAEDDADDDWWW